MKVSLKIVLIFILGILVFNATSYSDIENLRVPLASKEDNKSHAILNIVGAIKWLEDSDVDTSIKDELVLALREKIKSGHVSLDDLLMAALYNLLEAYKDYYMYFIRDYTVKESAAHIIAKLRKDVRRIKVFETIKRELEKKRYKYTTGKFLFCDFGCGRFEFDRALGCFIKSKYGFGMQHYESHGIERSPDLIANNNIRLAGYTSRDYPKPFIWEGNITSLGDVEEAFNFNARQKTFNLITTLHQSANYYDEVSMIDESNMLFNAHMLLNDEGAYVISYYTTEADIFNRYGMEDILIESGFTKAQSNNETVLLGTKMELNKAIMLYAHHIETDVILDVNSTRCFI